MGDAEFAALVREAQKIQKDVKGLQSRLDELAEKLSDYKKSGAPPKVKGKSLLDSLLGDDPPGGDD